MFARVGFFLCQRVDRQTDGRLTRKKYVASAVDCLMVEAKNNELSKQRTGLR